MKTKPTRRAARKVDFYWFEGESVSELYNQLYRSIGENPRLEVRQSNGKMTLRVVPQGSGEAKAQPTDINDSRACPPICPK